MNKTTVLVQWNDVALLPGTVTVPIFLFFTFFFYWLRVNISNYFASYAASKPLLGSLYGDSERGKLPGA